MKVTKNKHTIKQAVILAGGLGTRLRPLTLKTPKPMVKINGKPFLTYILTELKKNNISEVLILTGYLNEKIENYFKDGKKYGLKITYSNSGVEAETGTRLYQAKKLIHDKFILLYGDNFWPLQLNQLYSFWKEQETQGVMTIYTNRDKSTKNNALVNKGLVKVYDKKRIAKKLNGVDIGFFLLKREVLDLLPPSNVSFEEVVLPLLIKKKQLAGFLTEHKYYGLSNLERIPSIESFFTKKKVVFIDRDGVINKKAKKAEYIKTRKEFIFLPKVKEALKKLTKHNYTIIIVSNQAGIARKIITKKQVDLLHRKMLSELDAFGVSIAGIYICPHGWDENCFCRKPNPGMFFQAAAEHNIDLFTSYCIGDDPRDIVAGNRAGCTSILVGEDENSSFPDLNTAVHYILSL